MAHIKCVRNITDEQRVEAWLAIGEFLGFLSWQEPEPQPYMDEYICTIKCMENQLSPRDLAFVVHGEEGERATYPGSHMDRDGKPDMDSDYWLNLVECKSPVPSKAAISEGKNPLLWMAIAEQELQDEFKAELCALGVSTKIVKRFTERLFGHYEFVQGFIGRMEPSPDIVHRFCQAWKKSPALRHLRIPKRALSKIHRLCELRHDTKEQSEWWTKGEEPGDTIEVYDEWADVWRGGDCIGRKLSGSHRYADWGISEQRDEELDMGNTMLMTAAREVRALMDVELTLNKKLWAAREHIKEVCSHKTPEGKRTVPFVVEHKLIGVALSLLRTSGASANYRLSDVCKLWSMDGRMYGKVPYGFSYGSVSLNFCSDNYLSHMEDIHAEKVRAEFNAHIGKMRAHWAAMEQNGYHLLKMVDDPNFKVAEKAAVKKVIIKREAIQLLSGDFITKTTRPGDILFPLPVAPEEVTPEDVDVEYLEQANDIDQEWVLDDDVELWEE